MSKRKKNRYQSTLKMRQHMRDFGLFMKAKNRAKKEGNHHIYDESTAPIPFVKIKDDHGGDACHRIVSFSVKIGLLPNLTCGVIKCSDCDNRACYWEHRNYNEPLDIVPICQKCNFTRGSAIHVRTERRSFIRDAVRQFQLAAHSRESKFESYLSGMVLQYRAELLNNLKKQPSDLSYGGDHAIVPEQFTGIETLDGRARQR